MNNTLNSGLYGIELAVGTAFAKTTSNYITYILNSRVHTFLRAIINYLVSPYEWKISNKICIQLD
jgi:hypothetical protein